MEDRSVIPNPSLVLGEYPSLPERIPMYVFGIYGLEKIFSNPTDRRLSTLFSIAGLDKPHPSEECGDLMRAWFQQWSGNVPDGYPLILSFSIETASVFIPPENWERKEMDEMKIAELILNAMYTQLVRAGFSDALSPRPFWVMLKTEDME